MESPEETQFDDSEESTGGQPEGQGELSQEGDPALSSESDTGAAGEGAEKDALEADESSEEFEERGSV